MDGARFANALATLGCSPAAATWRVGVDVLSFGCTKTGGLNADAIVVFNANLVEDLSFRIRRSGPTWSKVRSQGQRTGRTSRSDCREHSRRQSRRAGRGKRGLLDLPEVKIDQLIKNGIQFLRREPRLIRLVY
jgi:threonine aldolase